MNNFTYLKPNWPVQDNIKALTTFRTPGHFNVASHVGDDAENVKRNREILKQELHLPSEPSWLSQTHSTRVVLAESGLTDADASYTQKPGVVAVVLTADCIPLLITNRQGTEVAAIHAGWRGLVDGIIGNTIKTLKSKPEDLLVWLGPSISASVYEVGVELYDAFAAWPMPIDSAFKATRLNHWLADLPALALKTLTYHGVLKENIYFSNACTYQESEKYFSARREGIQTGRIASLIYMK